jgi:hypothetical protein
MAAPKDWIFRILSCQPIGYAALRIGAHINGAKNLSKQATLLKTVRLTNFAPIW